MHRGSKTLQSIGRHYSEKWVRAGDEAPQLRFHAPASGNQQFAGTCWGPVIGKGVTVRRGEGGGRDGEGLERGGAVKDICPSIAILQFPARG